MHKMDGGWILILFFLSPLSIPRRRSRGWLGLGLASSTADAGIGGQGLFCSRMAWHGRLRVGKYIFDGDPTGAFLDGGEGPRALLFCTSSSELDNRHELMMDLSNGTGEVGVAVVTLRTDRWPLD